MTETEASTEDHENHESNENHYEAGLYEIRVKGHLGERWAARFEGMTLTLVDNGDTILAGTVVDQSALYGLLRKVRDLGMPLISVGRAESGKADPLDTTR